MNGPDTGHRLPIRSRIVPAGAFCMPAGRDRAQARTAAFALIAGAAIALAPATGAAEDKIQIGHLADYSGATSDVGVPYGRGVDDAFAWLNRNGGVAGRQLEVDTVDYSYQVPRAVATYKKWTGQGGLVAIQGWGTADTEALVDFVGKDKLPFMSGSYAAALTDPTGRAGKTDRPAPYNFFYGPSYSDSARALVQWAAEDWKKRGGGGKPKYVHMGANHPYPNAPRAAAEEYARELGFEVLPAIQFALAPGDYTAQCLTLKQSGANYAYLGNTAGSNISVLKACQTAGVKVQFLGNVWGMDENGAKAAGTAADGVVFPLRTAVTWTGEAAGMKLMQEVSRMSDPAGTAYRPVHYLAGVCTALYMSEAIAWAAANGGVSGPKIRDGMYARANWVPKGTEGVCKPSTWTAEDHRSMLQVDLYRMNVGGPTEAPVDELVRKGVIRLTRVASVDLPRKKEWLGW